MTEVPPLVLLLTVDPSRPHRILGAWRRPDGSVQAGLDRRPEPVPSGALLLYWPARFGWTPAAQALADAVRDRDGALFPLAVVMERLGLPPARSLQALSAVLAPDLVDAVDPELVGRRLVEELAARLAAVGKEDPPRAADRDAGAASAAVPRAPAAGVPVPSTPPAPPRSGAPPRPRPAAGVLFALEDLPSGPGVYSFLAADGKALYVGKAKSLRARVPRHFDARPAEPAKSEALVGRAARLVWESAGSDLEASLREQLALARELPPLNTQERAHVRRRGSWRRAVVLLLLPSAAGGRVEVCLVAGDGRFHWETVARRRRVPRGLWRRLGAFLAGEARGWAPGRSDARLSADEARQLAEVALSWLARHGDAVTRIDLAAETAGRHLQARLRVLLGEDPAAGRTEAR